MDTSSLLAWLLFSGSMSEILLAPASAGMEPDSMGSCVGAAIERWKQWRLKQSAEHSTKEDKIINYVDVPTMNNLSSVRTRAHTHTHTHTHTHSQSQVQDSDCVSWYFSFSFGQDIENQPCLGGQIIPV